MLPFDPGTSKIFFKKVKNGPGSALSYSCPQANAGNTALMTDLQQDFNKHRMELSRVTMDINIMKITARTAPGPLKQFPGFTYGLR